MAFLLPLFIVGSTILSFAFPAIQEATKPKEIKKDIKITPTKIKQPNANQPKPPLHELQLTKGLPIGFIIVAIVAIIILIMVIK